ncbi:glycoside hydrolase family 125 protein [Sphingomonas mollis]|uniref:Glycoside hydrolase family 125 protein n=1 Tax=Sphingomonas mollis TaxID=2795726 RepID=A0ABS0XNS9_9SPHN|nr:glycoside hydrolase family 125 protein [Sphingomonas sp. BT553]MBJ6121667.1 glycoside hydrolase family 125 protein [Sphingomonas sp. BT553]
MTIDRRMVLAGGLALAGTPAFAAPAFPDKRPARADRRFTSPAVEREIVRVSKLIADPKLRWMFGNCYPNTLDTTVKMGTIGGQPDAFVITGDIPCLWLRDSAAQVKPYLHLVRNDPKLGELFSGLIARQARSILIDPYANAFMEDPTAKTNLGWALTDETTMKPGVAERKWEIDSLCYPMRLAHGYWQATRDPRPFDATWAQAARTSIRTFREQQRKDGPAPYSFRRSAPQPTETLLWGHGNPTRPVGLIHSGFRPSDDACLYPFLIPANLFAVSALRELATVASEARQDTTLATEATTLATEVEAALRQWGTMRLKDGREVWAYEVDGYGNAVFMDDANVPSLSGLAYLGCVAPTDPLWQRTRDAAWSEANPWFFRGTKAEGIGGPHVGAGQIWPMSLTIRALSATDDATILACLRTLRDTDGGTGFIHEAFDQDNPAKFTREWFAWANGLFGELIVHLAATRPALMKAPL